MTIPAIGHVYDADLVTPKSARSSGSTPSSRSSATAACAAEKTSADSSRRMPVSKQRNRHLQTVLLEAAHLAPDSNPELAVLYEREAAHSNRNQAAITVARKLYLPSGH